LAVLSTIGGLLNVPFFSEDDAHTAHDTHEYGSRLALEHWLEPLIQSFGLTEEGILHMPHTPTWLQADVAVVSTVFAVVALISSFFFIYKKFEEKDGEHYDPLHIIPPFSIAKVLPFDSLYMKIFVPMFSKFGIDLAVADNEVTDSLFVGSVTDGLGGLSRLYKLIQSGLVRNYALSLFAGVVALLVMFLFGGA